MKTVLTGDRPTGKLHLGHFTGSIRERLKLQNSGEYEMYIMIADVQALTDNFKDPKKIKDHVLDVAIDNLACGIDPNKTTLFVQSSVKPLFEATIYFMNLVTLARALRNPTVKQEIKLRNFDQDIPLGFLNYPISQAADILLFDTDIVPVGNDQEPMIEQTREIAKCFNNYYGDTLKLPEILLNTNLKAQRLVGLDGEQKMSKSLNNAIFLGDSEEELKSKVMKMYTDPNHIRVEDPGKIEGNTVFTYLDVFSNNEYFSQYLPQYNNLQELKDAYQKGGVGDVLIKKFLFNVLNDILKPIREKRRYYEENIDLVKDILKKGNIKANKKALEVITEMRKKMMVE